MEFYFTISQLTNNQDGSVTFERRQWLKDQDGNNIPLSPTSSIWRTPVYPEVNVDLVAALSRDGANLDEEFKNLVRRVYEPGLHALWTEDYVKAYKESSNLQI